MLTASDELHKYLAAHGDDAFLDFTEKVGFMKVIRTHYIHPGAGSFDSERSLTIREWLKREESGISARRNALINDILGTQHTDRPLFDRACREAGIRTDEARTLTIAQHAKWWGIATAIITVVIAEGIKYLVTKGAHP